MRWWRGLHERLGKYFKEQLIALLRRNLFNPHDFVLQENQDFLDIALSTRLQDLIQHPEELKPTETMNAFLYLKERLHF